MKLVHLVGFIKKERDHLTSGVKGRKILKITRFKVGGGEVWQEGKENIRAPLTREKPISSYRFYTVALICL